MTILSSIASLLESAAMALRAADLPKQDAAIPKEAASKPAQKIQHPKGHPYGYWRCTRANGAPFTDFLVGGVYLCRPDMSGGPRIYPWKGSTWAPYWSGERFCYPRTDLDFEYLGTTLPKGATLITTRPADPRLLRSNSPAPALA